MHVMNSGDGPDDEWMRRHSAPENEAPVAVPVSAVLARTDTAAVMLSGVQVHTTGVSFTLGLRCRPEALDRFEDRSIGGLLWRHGRRGEQLLFGVELADGRRASNASGEGDPFGQLGGPEGLVLNSGGGGGGQLAADQTWWMSPLPPAGPLRLVVRCDLLGIPDTVTELDGAAIRAAADRVVTLWPWVSPADAEPAMPPPGPDVPPDSWFARA
ncbi:hypothetical protein GCU67_07030 [Modestobacter muralis]|uniref:Uncharacterized protein n=1 Tax=Modestobacter muralis TaxID=1608614 RepID=A0A6P0ETY9_9ACTN|nr:hypothetical protein [Modestobacter muralis]NEK93929.1 hypothetical protein [Modestobacter muralis]NEN50696.1 hypothetical protein [Modestobacter muralis]